MEHLPHIKPVTGWGAVILLVIVALLLWWR